MKNARQDLRVERPDVVTLIMYEQGKEHCMGSWPGAANCLRPFTLLTTPHCSRAVSTLFLSENILRMLKDRGANQQRAASSEKLAFTADSSRAVKWKSDKGQEGKEEVAEGHWCLGRG